MVDFGWTYFCCRVISMDQRLKYAGGENDRRLTESPTAAIVVSLLGGVFVCLGGIVLVVLGTVFESLGNLGGLLGSSSLPSDLLGNLTSISGGTGAVGSPIAALGVLGVLTGVAMIALAILVHMFPVRHQLLGGLVVTLSLVSWVGALGGLFIGFLLGLIGGILAIAWKPSPTPAQISRICPNCGTVIQKDTKFCPHCGKSLP